MKASTRWTEALGALLDGRARLGMTVVGLVRLAERLLLTSVALSFSAERLRTALAITVVLAVLTSVRATVKAPLVALLRARFVARITHALLARRAPAPATKDASVVLFEGLWVAEDLLSDRIPGIIADALAAAILGVVACTRLPSRVVLVGGVALVIAGAVLELARRIAGRHAQRSFDAFLPVAAAVDGCAEGGLELLANGRAHDGERVVVDLARRWSRIGWRADWLAGLSGRMPILVGFLGLMMGVVYLEVARGAALEAAFATALVIASFLPPFASLLTNIVALAQARPRLVPVADLLSEASAPEPFPPRSSLDPIAPAAIRWEGLAYAYGAGPAVFTDLGGVWTPGRIVGIAGANGAGKSTLFRLLLGLDRPTRGSIVLGEAPLESVSSGVWRRSIAYLPQRPFLPGDASVREAVRFLVPEASEAAMEEVLRRVGVWPRLTRSSPPLELPLSRLSAGERQRIALARVLLQDAPLLLLDEPDANLDRNGVALLGELLRSERSKRMVLFIAHDEELLAAADDVIRITSG